MSTPYWSDGAAGPPLGYVVAYPRMDGHFIVHADPHTGWAFESVEAIPSGHFTPGDTVCALVPVTAAAAARAAVQEADRTIDIDAPMATGDAFFTAYDNPMLAAPGGESRHFGQARHGASAAAGMATTP